MRIIPVAGISAQVALALANVGAIVWLGGGMVNAAVAVVCLFGATPYVRALRMDRRRKEGRRSVSRFRHFKQGMHFRFPLCCILRFCLARSLYTGVGQAVERGVRGDRQNNIHVPCGVFHKAERSL